MNEIPAKQRWVKEGHLSFGEFLIKILKEDGPDSEIIKGLIMMYGRENLEEIYRQEVRKMKGTNSNS